jgi:hypothetical protein
MSETGPTKTDEVFEAHKVNTPEGAIALVERLLTPMPGRQWLYHATSQTCAMQILQDGFSVTDSRNRNDFGPGLYLNPSLTGAWEWAFEGWRASEPALLVYEVPPGTVWFKLHGTSKPKWQSVVDYHRLRIANGSYDVIEFSDCNPLVCGAQAFPG